MLLLGKRVWKASLEGGSLIFSPAGRVCWKIKQKQIIGEDNGWLRWAYIALWSSASVLSGPPPAVLPLNCPGTQKSVSHVFLPLPGSALSWAPWSGAPAIAS